MENSLLARVIDCIARATRYPVKLLQPSADLEIDLGIDSVKRLEVVVELEKEFGLELSSQPKDSSVKTIEDIATWVGDMMGGEPQPSSPSSSVASSGSANGSLPDRSNAFRDPSNWDADPGNFGIRTDQQKPSPNPNKAFDGFRDGSIVRRDSFHSTPAPAPVSRDFSPQPRPATPAGGSLVGKIAFVTGSGRSVGKVIARVLAARGAMVIVNSFHSREAGEQTVAEINNSGGQAVHIWGSVASPAQVENMFDEIESRFGKLDILVCNASDGQIGSFMELNSEDWDRAFRTNVSGHHQCAVRASRLMQRVGGGAIVTMSAVGAHGHVDGLGSQGVVKAAVESLSRYLACELGKFGIRVNCVAGGPVYGDLLSKFPNAQTAQHHWESVAPDGHLTTPLDLANTIAFLVSNEARGVNGAVWTVDHGFSAMESGQPVPRPMSNVTQAAVY